ncbi:MAG: hypothetical protein ABSF64_35465 [Bryobacteraceae bacterium]|jgi:hypothetical protein
MGYTHYWHRPRTIPDPLWDRIRSDFDKLILPLSDACVVLAGGLGKGPPEITNEAIRFNGPEECGHLPNDELVIPYPSKDGEGIGPSETAIDGDFFGLGVTVKHRCCDGSCCYETFEFDKSMDTSDKEPDADGLYIEYVKTGFRPYDIAVTSALLIIKHYLGDQFVVHSNGADAQWSDARRICQKVLGYGDWFGIIEEPIIEEGPDEREVTLHNLVEYKPPEMS